MSLGPSLPPAELARRDLTFFVKVERLFSTTPKAEIFSKSSWIETETNGGHWCDQTLNRTRSRHVRTRPVSDNSSMAHGLGFITGTYGHSLDRRVRSGARGTTNTKGRSDASGRVWMLTGIDQTLSLWHPISLSGTSDRVVSNANQWRPDASARPINFDRRIRSL
jgi:hypothetical protein